MDFIAGVIELLALYVIGSKNKFGFLFNMVAGICWILHVYFAKESYGLLLIVVPALFINAKNYRLWNKK